MENSKENEYVDYEIDLDGPSSKDAKREEQIKEEYEDGKLRDIDGNLLDPEKKTMPIEDEKEALDAMNKKLKEMEEERRKGK